MIFVIVLIGIVLLVIVSIAVADFIIVKFFNKDFIPVLPQLIDTFRRKTPEEMIRRSVSFQIFGYYKFMVCPRFQIDRDGSLVMTKREREEVEREIWDYQLDITKEELKKKGLDSSEENAKKICEYKHPVYLNQRAEQKRKIREKKFIGKRRKI
ncbi:MAG: hypothetical protein PHE43_02360 [Candidatus Nanoarchaeia archaeon]|nr:hypothetical protein [Candidatus Nanoarchaeia archaeon]